MLLRLLVTILNRNGENQNEKKPWDKDNSWLINTKIKPEITVTPVIYRNMYTLEKISTGITDISITVIKI